MLPSLPDPAVLLADAKKFASTVYFWLGLIVALGFALGLIAMWLRKKLMTPYNDITPMGFTLKDLREMHAQGQLSDEELAAAEEKALARTRSHYLGQEADSSDGGVEVEDVGHLSTDDEEDSDNDGGDSGAGTENVDGSADKNGDDEPKP